MWEIALTKRALKDAKKVTRAGLKPKVDQLINILKTNPYQNPPAYEKLTGDLAEIYSRRINIQHRRHWFSLIVGLKTLPDKGLTENTKLKEFFPS
jgi:Txe/YoeB family toxin of toxin-antitoxin system